jgi:hypothetical protein
MWRASTMTRCIAAAVAIGSGRGATATAQHTAQHTQTQAYGAGGVGLGAATSCHGGGWAAPAAHSNAINLRIPPEPGAVQFREF